MASWSKERTLQFIELYRSHECLWRVKSKDYSNKIKREKSYEELTNFVKSFYPDANKDTVVGKISNLRSSWRKEYKKMISPHISGGDLEDVYEPSLFYFHNLLFIADSHVPRTRRGSREAATGSPTPSTSQEHSLMSDKDGDSQEHSFPSHDGDIKYIDDDEHSNRSTPSIIPTYNSSTPSILPTHNSSTPSIIPTHNTPGGSTTPVDVQVPRYKQEPAAKRRRACQDDDLQLFACQKLNAPSCGALQNDEYESFGQTVAHDLRSMPRLQCIHAKKLISDVLYEGQLGNLSRGSSLLAVPDTRSSARPCPNPGDDVPTP